MDIQMHVPLDIDSRSNFRLQGLRSWLPNDPAEISATGVATYYIVGDTTGFLSRLQPATVNGVTISTLVNASGSVAVIQFVISNNADTAQTVSLAVETDVLIDWNRRSTITKRSDGSGFQVASDLMHFQVVCRDSPVVTNVDSFWFGSAFVATDFLWDQVEESEVDAQDLAFALGWKDRRVPANGRLALSVMMVWGDGLTPPNGTIESVPEQDKIVDWEEEVSLTGTVQGAIAVYLIVDGVTMQITQPVDDRFSIPFTPSALHLTTGNHSFMICAVDATGAVSTLSTFAIRVLAPTEPQTRTPIASRSPSPSASISASWGEPQPPVWEGPAEESQFDKAPAQIVMGVGIPIGLILIVAFSLLLYRFRRKAQADMEQRLRSSSATDASATGMGV
jgi:hypothetical protein